MGLFSNYCGFGGSGRVQHPVDALCKKHDEEYGILQKHNVNPYLSWNAADTNFLKGLSQLKENGGVRATLVKKFAQNLFQFKKELAPEADISLSDLQDMVNLRYKRKKDDDSSSKDDDSTNPMNNLLNSGYKTTLKKSKYTNAEILPDGTVRYNDPKNYETPDHGLLRAPPGASPQVHESLSNRMTSRTINFDEEAEDPEPMETAAAPGQSEGRRGTFVTPIDDLPITRPFRDTVTTLCTADAYFSANGLLYASDSVNNLKIRMNTILTPLNEQTITAQNGQGRRVLPGVSTTKAGMYLIQQKWADFCWAPDNLHDAFPRTTTTSMSCYDQHFWCLHYRAYTILKCDWTIHIDFPHFIYNWTNSSNVDDDAAGATARIAGINAVDASFISDRQQLDNVARAATIFWTYDTESTATGNEANISTNAYHDLLRWPGIVGSKTIFQGQNATISGTWTPDMLHHNPVNDSYKTIWHEISAGSPSLPALGWLEHLRVYFKKDWRTLIGNTTEASNEQTFGGLNMHVNLRYTCQFKGLHDDVLWPQDGLVAQLSVTYPPSRTNTA